MARDFKIELDNVEMINGSDDLLKDTKVTKVTLTGENKLNSLNSTFENCTELTAIEGDVNLDGVSDMTEMTLNTPLDELKVTNPTEENIQTDNSLNQVTNVKIGGTKYAKGGVQDIVGSLEWNAENFTYEDTILDNVYTNSSSIEDSKNLTVSDTLEQKATSIEITGQTYENLVNGKATENLLDEMSMQQTEGKPTQFTPHMEQPICLEYIEGQTYQNLVDGKGEKTLISEYSPVINDFVPNTFKPPQNQPICLESMEGETYQNLIKGKGEYKLTDTFSTTWTESNNSIENPPSMIEIPEIWGNTVQGYANEISYQAFIDNFNGIKATDGGTFKAVIMDDGTINIQNSGRFYAHDMDFSEAPPITLKPNTQYSLCLYNALDNTLKKSGYIIVEGSDVLVNYSIGELGCAKFTTKSSGAINIFPCSSGIYNIMVVEGDVELDTFTYDEVTLESIQSVGDLYVNESGEPILDEEGNEQYKLEIESSNTLFNEKYLKEGFKKELYNGRYVYHATGSEIDNGLFVYNKYKFKENTQYHIKYECANINNVTWKNLEVVYTDGTLNKYTVVVDNLEGKNHIITQANKTVSKLGFTIGGRYNPLYIYADSIIISETDDNYDLIETDKTTILMPQPLRKVGDFCDKLYWDYVNNKYLIEKNIFGKQLNNKFNAYPEVYESVMKVGMILANSNINDEFTGSTFVAKGYTSIDNGRSMPFNIFQTQAVIVVSLPLSVLSDSTVEAFNAYLDENPIYVYYLVKSQYVQIIETKILEKPSLEAYSPKTYITTNTEVQPSQMTVTNKEVKFIPISLQPSKSYTIQLDSVGKDNKPITVNLGGATTTIQPTNDTSKHHRTSITTPSTLTTDNLDLSGEGVIVNDVMLFEGNTSAIKQDVDYMDGIQSIGELFESRNLFDYTQSELGLLDHTNGNISKDNSWKYTTDFIPVEPNTTYCISQTSGSVFNYKIVEYNSSKTYLKGTNWTSSKGTDINRAYNTFTTSANTYYLRLGWQSSIFEIQLEEDTFPTEFMAFDTVRYKLEIQTYDSTWDKL